MPENPRIQEVSRSHSALRAISITYVIFFTLRGMLRKRNESKVAMNPPERLAVVLSGNSIHHSCLLLEACQKSLAFAHW
jgi:hypothetical protein